MSPKVTIGIPTVNRSEMLIRAARSVLAQSYSNIELLVSDDASEDDTLARIAEIEDSRLVVHPHQTRLGLVGNFNFCLGKATGEFFLLLGDDDLLLPRAIERLVEPFLKEEPIGVTWCPCLIADADGRHYWRTKPGPEREKPADMLAALWGGKRGPRLSGIMMRTAEAVAAGGYQKRYGDLCDIGLWAAVALKHQWIACVDEVLVRYTNHHGSTTSKSYVCHWQDGMQLVHADLLSGADPVSRKTLQAAKRNFLSSISLTVLIQTIGKPGWIGSALREIGRSPRALLRPYVAIRLITDGWKLLMLSRLK